MLVSDMVAVLHLQYNSPIPPCHQCYCYRCSETKRPPPKHAFNIAFMRGAGDVSVQSQSLVLEKETASKLVTGGGLENLYMAESPRENYK